MSQYRAPLSEMLFVMNELAGLARSRSSPASRTRLADTVAAILEEAGKFATDVLDPLNSVGDREGARLRDDGCVVTPPGFRDAYRQFCELGWNGLAKDRPNTAARACRSSWRPRSTRCGTPPTWRSSSARCSPAARSRRSR